MWSMLCVALIFLLPISLLLAVPTEAQQPACEDNLRASRVYLDQLLRSRQRQETDAAQAVADLLKRVDMLQAQIDMLLKQREGK